MRCDTPNVIHHIHTMCIPHTSFLVYRPRIGTITPSSKQSQGQRKTSASASKAKV